MLLVELLALTNLLSKHKMIYYVLEILRKRNAFLLYFSTLIMLVSYIAFNNL